MLLADSLQEYALTSVEDRVIIIVRRNETNLLHIMWLNLRSDELELAIVLEFHLYDLSVLVD